MIMKFQIELLGKCWTHIKMLKAVKVVMEIEPLI